jgi:hypothetical protein
MRPDPFYGYLSFYLYYPQGYYSFIFWGFAGMIRYTSEKEMRDINDLLVRKKKGKKKLFSLAEIVLISISIYASRTDSLDLKEGIK